jgi:hypothetical protein
LPHQTGSRGTQSLPEQRHPKRRFSKCAFSKWAPAQLQWGVRFMDKGILSYPGMATKPRDAWDTQNPFSQAPQFYRQEPFRQRIPNGIKCLSKKRSPDPLHQNARSQGDGANGSWFFVNSKSF